MTLYKPNQGAYARATAAGALLLVDLLASVRFFQWAEIEHKFSVFGLQVPFGFIWAAVLFVGLAVVIAVFTAGYGTGMRGIDAKTRGFVDLLIDTQTELQKVSWPDRDELVRSTTVVMVCMLVLGVFLFCVDLLLSTAMQIINVLPK
jgi:preprotein translocase subunit SecE